MQLNDIQTQFKDLMLDHPDALNAPEPAFAAAFQSGDIALSTRLQVYRNNIIGGLSDVIIASFPTIESLVGKDFLEGMARSFVLASPPKDGCLQHYGDDFAAFVATFEPAKSLAYLPDIARLEIALNAAYYAKDDTPMAHDALSRIPADTLGDAVLTLRDAVQLVQSDYPITAIQNFALNPDANADAETSAAVDMDAGGEYVMVMRPALDTQIVLLSDDEFLMLMLLNDGISLGDAVGQTLEQCPAFNFQAFLQKHLALETFCEIGTNR